MKKKLLTIVPTMALAAFLMTGCGSGKTADNVAPAAAETAKTEGGENSRDAGNSSDAVTDKASMVADRIGPSGGVGTLTDVAVPTKNLQRWNQDSANMKVELEAVGYGVDLQYVNNDVQTQVSQIENMISNGCQMLVIISIGGSSPGEPLGQAKGAGILVISCDHLIMNSDAVTYCVTFGNYKVGQKQGEYLVEALGLEIATEPKNIELFTDDPTDNSCNFFFGGTMDVLQKYIDEGKLVVKLGQTVFEQVATANWDSEKTQSRMDTIIAGNYSDGTVLDAVLCSNDSAALSAENVLASPYTGTYPAITGQDCDIANIKSMLSGKRTMSMFKDTRTLATQVVKMVDAVMQGGEAEINDSSSYDNGTGVTPTYLCEPVVVTVDNCREMLVDSGYCIEDQTKQISIQKRIPPFVKRRGKTDFRDG